MLKKIKVTLNLGEEGVATYQTPRLKGYLESIRFSSPNQLAAKEITVDIDNFEIFHRSDHREDKWLHPRVQGYFTEDDYCKYYASRYELASDILRIEIRGNPESRVELTVIYNSQPIEEDISLEK